MRKTLTSWAITGTTAALAALAAASMTPAHATGTVAVTYVQPQQFADIGIGQIERDRNLESLSRVFQDLKDKLLDGQTLTLQVTDVNLAGELQFAGAQPDLRVVRGRADWPSMRLSYRLMQNGSVLKSGEARLSDPSYTFGLQSVRQGEPMRYERRMVADWFDTAIGGR